jgi:molecular chaperone DnaK
MSYRLIHSVNKNLAEHKDKLDEATIAEIKKSIDEAKEVESSTDAEVIKTKVSALSSAAMKIGQAMYKKDGSNSDSSKPAGDAASSETKDAQYEEKK